jgi:hypothetical protein
MFPQMLSLNFAEKMDGILTSQNSELTHASQSLG